MDNQLRILERGSIDPGDFNNSLRIWANKLRTLPSGQKITKELIDSVDPRLLYFFISDHYKKYLAIGKSTKTIDRYKVSQIINKFLEIAGHEEKTILFFDSPLSCQMAINTMSKLIKSGKLANLSEQLNDNLWGQLGIKLWSQLDSNLCNQLRSQLYSQIRIELDSKLWGHLGSQLKSQLKNQLEDGFEYHPTKFWGSYESYWVSTYKCAQSLGVNFEKDDSVLLNNWDQFCKESFYVYFFDKVVIVSDRPEKYTDNKIIFRDGWTVNI